MDQSKRGGIVVALGSGCRGTERPFGGFEMDQRARRGMVAFGSGFCGRVRPFGGIEMDKGKRGGMVAFGSGLGGRELPSGSASMDPGKRRGMVAFGSGLKKYLGFFESLIYLLDLRHILWVLRNDGSTQQLLE